VNYSSPELAGNKVLDTAVLWCNDGGTSAQLMTQMTMNHDLCTEHTAACELYALLQNPGLSNRPWT